MALSRQEQIFATEYIKLGSSSAVQAALNAGYAPGTARYASRWINESNLHKPTKHYKPELHEYIKKLQNAKLSDNIKSIEEVQQFWSNNIDDVTLEMKDRIKSSELLVKSKGGFTDKVEVKGQIDNPMAGLTTEELKKLINSG